MSKGFLGLLGLAEIAKDALDLSEGREVVEIPFFASESDGEAAKAIADALDHGTGYLRITRQGAERIDPKTVLVTEPWDATRECLHCGVQTRVAHDACWRCGLWHSKLKGDDDA